MPNDEKLYIKSRQKHDLITAANHFLSKMNY